MLVGLAGLKAVTLCVFSNSRIRAWYTAEDICVCQPARDVEHAETQLYMPHIAHNISTAQTTPLVHTKHCFFLHCTALKCAP